jgi:hypothetical protein
VDDVEKPRRKHRRKVGRPRKWRMTEARRRANAVRNWRHGLRSRSGITSRDVLRAKLQRTLPGAAETIDAYISAANGDTKATDALAAKAMAETAIMQQLTMEDVLTRGPITEEPMVSQEGEIVGSRVRAHPGLSALRHLHEQLGFTAEQLMLTRKSNTEKLAPAGMEQRLRERRARLVELVKRGLGPPPPESDSAEEHWLPEPTSGKGSPN